MKNKLLSVSIIIPVYNEEKYIENCIKSLIKQSYKNLEIVIVNDGSTDNSITKINNYKVKVLNQAHSGPGVARNFGAKNAQGEILAFLDADMEFDKKYIENLIQPILKNKALGTFNKEELVANPENIWSKCWSINSSLPYNRRLPISYPDTENAFRAILKTTFIKRNGFDINIGYMDDSSFSKKTKIKAVNASKAISYHYNPSTLKEVFYSARWIGRSINFKPNLMNLMRYSILNSLRVAFKFFLAGAPWRIFIFKIVYDFGMFSGIFLKGKERHK